MCSDGAPSGEREREMVRRVECGTRAACKVRITVTASIIANELIKVN